MARSDPATLCVDLGKTTCRVAVLQGSVTLAQDTGEGLPGAAAPDAARMVADHVARLAAGLPQHVLSSAVRVGAGVAGALAAPEAARRIADALAQILRRPVALSSDIVTAHVGALAGHAGVTLVAGTGAVALGVDHGGALRVVDGWGPDLGDLGSGSWLGREGIRAVLRAAVALGPATKLTDALRVLTDDTDPVHWVSGAPSPARAAARFAPAVLDLAAGGDIAALQVAERALAHLAETARAAAPGDSAAVAVLGGLTQNAWFADRLTRSLEATGLRPIRPAGTAMDGARDIACRSDFPHERYIHRAQ